MEVTPEEDYGSDFEDSKMSGMAQKQETQNIKATNNIQYGNQIQETSHFSNITQVSPQAKPQVNKTYVEPKIEPKSVQNKITSKPNFMLKRKF